MSIIPPIVRSPWPWLVPVLLVASERAAVAQLDERLEPRQPAPAAAVVLPGAPRPSGDAGLEPLIPALGGIVFVPSADAVVAAGVTAEGIEADELPILQGAIFRARVEPFLGRPLTMATLDAITNAVVLAYGAAGRPVVDAIVPEQDITGGTVQVLVIEGRVGRVRTEGNRHFRSERIVAGVSLKAGGSIERDRLLDDIDFLNRNPFRHADVIFERGREPGETDVVLRVADQTPVRLYAGYENTGSVPTSEHRFYGGGNWGDAFGFDHRASYQFTTAPEYDRFHAHSASYAVPLPWRHELRFFGSFSRSRPDTGAVGAEAPQLRGTNWQVGLRYEIPLRRFSWMPEGAAARALSLTHALQLGLDFKRINNNLEFGGEQVFDNDLDVAVLSAAYVAQATDAAGRTSLALTAYLSPGEITGANSAAAYETARPGANPSFGYLNVTLDRQTRLPGRLEWSARLQAQVSSGALVSTEQLGFGGRDQVRGYPTFIGTGDAGFIMENEIISPAWSPLASTKLIRERDALRVLGFWDYGQGYTRGPIANGQQRLATYSSVGVGLRYAIGSRVSVQYDFAVPLIEAPGGSRSSVHHVAVQVNVPF